MNSQMLKSLILLAFGLSVAALAIYRLRTYRLKERYALLLILIGAPFIVMAVWQDAVGVIAEMLGIQYTTFSLLCVTAFLFVMIFELLTIVSIQEQKINTLSQMVGLMSEKRPEDLADRKEPAQTRQDGRR